MEVQNEVEPTAGYVPAVEPVHERYMRHIRNAVVTLAVFVCAVITLYIVGAIWGYVQYEHFIHALADVWNNYSSNYGSGA